MHDWVEALGKTELFEGLTPAGVELITTVAEELHVPHNDFVFKEGDEGDRLYLIVSGTIRISKQIPSVGEETLAVLNQGDAFGEMSLIGNFPRSADAIAHTDCRLIWIGKQQLDHLLFLNKDLAYEVLWNFVRILSARLRETNDKMTFLTVTSKF